MGKIVTLEFESEKAAKRYVASVEGNKPYWNLNGIKSVEEDWHTPHELYQHRYELWRALCLSGQYRSKAWRSRLHSDGSMFEDSFIVGINLVPAIQEAAGNPRNDVTYHLPNSWWDKFDGVKILDKAPEWDGATPEEGLFRLEAYVDWIKTPKR